MRSILLSSSSSSSWQRACFQCCMKSVCQQTIILAACDVRSLAELQGFYFSYEVGGGGGGGVKDTPLFALHPPLVSTQVWAATFCQLAPRLLPSHSSINDLTYSKTNNGNFPLVFQSKHARPAVSAAPRPNQHQMFFSLSPSLFPVWNSTFREDGNMPGSRDFGLLSFSESVKWDMHFKRVLLYLHKHLSMQ